MGKDSSPNEEPLVVSGHFNYSRREPKDRFWAYAYAACLAFTVIGGIVTIKSRSGALHTTMLSSDRNPTP